MLVTCNAQSARGINVIQDNVPTMILLQPGESRDVTLVNPKDRVFLGWVKSRDLLVTDTDANKAAEAHPAAQHPAQAKPAAPTPEAVAPDKVPPDKPGAKN